MIEERTINFFPKILEEREINITVFFVVALLLTLETLKNHFCTQKNAIS